MPNTAPRPTPGTLGQLLAYDMDLTVYCRCGHNARVDLAKLVGRLGHDRSYVGPALTFRWTASIAP